jgi:flagellar basal-body rod modification protein FlgD
MATSAITSPLAGLPASATTGSSATAAPTEDANASADRFLKLLVAQMQNQDPLNPMDNAQVTSQMAQINTVNGIEKLNTGLQGLSSQFMQLQVMQGTALVGRDVVVPGNHIAMTDGVGRAGYELSGAAKTVKVEISNAAGKVLDTIELGKQTAGIHDFEWTPGDKLPANTDPSTLRFKVTSSTGEGAAKEATALMVDRVNSISTSGKNLNLELQVSGPLEYSKVKAFN